MGPDREASTSPAPDRSPETRPGAPGSSAIVTLPNALSFARILAIPAFVALVVHRGTETWGIALFAVVASTDWLDGYVARHTGRVSDLGTVLDPVADRLALASAICKAATGATTRPGIAALGGDGTAARVRELLQDSVPTAGARGLRALATATIAIAVGAALTMPAAVSGLGDPITMCGG
jgi:phosphatidylglycerophosphate synthase